ncbi:MAG: hypothetical protein R3321_00355 [Nitrososphaeraceae archaeon]|nr:hypothetical protein [Nitrososphaeraceae archaeon]
MLTATEIGLTQRVQSKIKNLQEVSVPYAGYVVQQPSFNSTEYTLEDLFCDIDEDFNQSPLNPRKVKDIISKTDTGLINNDFYLFNPIFVGSVQGQNKRYIVSGRHRLEAIGIIATICEMDFSETKLDVLEVVFDSVELLSIAIAAYNTNRTMTKPERERVVLAASMEGELPILQNIKGNVGTAKKCEKFFKQLIYRVILGHYNYEQQKELLTEYTIYKVSTYLWKLLTEDEIIELKKSSEVLWGKLVAAILKGCETHLFVKPNYNISRDTEALENLAITLYSYMTE